MRLFLQEENKHKDMDIELFLGRNIFGNAVLFVRNLKKDVSRGLFEFYEDGKIQIIKQNYLFTDSFGFKVDDCGFLVLSEERCKDCDCKKQSKEC